MQTAAPSWGPYIVIGPHGLRRPVGMSTVVDA